MSFEHLDELGTERVSGHGVRARNDFAVDGDTAGLLRGGGDHFSAFGGERGFDLVRDLAALKGLDELLLSVGP